MNLTHRNNSSGLCGYVCVFALCLSSFPSKEGGAWALGSEYNIDKDVLTDCISFLTYRKSAVIQKPSTQTPKVFHQHGIAGKVNSYLG